MGVLAYFQVIKYKLCRCAKNKHKGRNNNDRGGVLSLDDVKRHVSRPLLSTVTNCIALTGAHSLLCLHCSRSEDGGRNSGGRMVGRKSNEESEEIEMEEAREDKDLRDTIGNKNEIGM